MLSDHKWASLIVRILQDVSVCMWFHYLWFEYFTKSMREKQQLNSSYKHIPVQKASHHLKQISKGYYKKWKKIQSYDEQSVNVELFMTDEHLKIVKRDLFIFIARV